VVAAANRGDRAGERNGEQQAKSLRQRLRVGDDGAAVGGTLGTAPSCSDLLLLLRLLLVDDQRAIRFDSLGGGEEKGKKKQTEKLETSLETSLRK